MPFRELKTEAEFDELLGRGDAFLLIPTTRRLGLRGGVVPPVEALDARLGGRLPMYVVYDEDTPEIARRYYVPGGHLVFFKGGVELYRVGHGLRGPDDLATLVDGYFGLKV